MFQRCYKTSWLKEECFQGSYLTPKKHFSLLYYVT
ncbi:unnamed protein product [Tenebrio molitor]|nr:unnamed protein product [Tenebrio molitor]